MIAGRLRSAQISPISRMIWREVLGSRLAVGSSISSSSGSCCQRAGDADALALAAGKRVGALVGMSVSPTRSSSAKASRRRRCGKRAEKLRQKPAHSRAGRTARSPSPSAARPGRIPGRSCPCAGARGAAARAQRGDLVSPLSRTRPPVGSTSRLTQRISVDLPAPDGPIRPTTCRPALRSDALQRLVAGR
jgi:hypothetical protein